MPTHPSRVLRIAFVTVLSLIGSLLLDAGTSWAAVPAPAAAPSKSSTGTTFEKEVLRLINKARSTKRKCGSKTYTKAKALKWNSKLALAAARHSSDMATRNYFSHTSKSGKKLPARIKATGYKYKAIGETLGAGYSTPKALVKAWLKSAPHCRILMSKSFTQLGVGHRSGKGKYVTYTTADFGKPK